MCMKNDISATIAFMDKVVNGIDNVKSSELDAVTVIHIKHTLSNAIDCLDFIDYVTDQPADDGGEYPFA